MAALGRQFVNSGWGPSFEELKKPLLTPALLPLWQPPAPAWPLLNGGAMQGSRGGAEQGESAGWGR